MIFIEAGYCKGCGICIYICPKHVLDTSKELSSRGYYPPEVVDAEACSNCRQCELYCPDCAIFTVEEDEHAKR